MLAVTRRAAAPRLAAVDLAIDVDSAKQTEVHESMLGGALPGLHQVHLCMLHELPLHSQLGCASLQKPFNELMSILHGLPKCRYNPVATTPQLLQTSLSPNGQHKDAEAHNTEPHRICIHLLQL